MCEYNEWKPLPELNSAQILDWGGAYCTPGREKFVPSVVVMLEHSGKDHEDSYYAVKIAIIHW